MHDACAFSIMASGFEPSSVLQVTNMIAEVASIGSPVELNRHRH